MDKSFNTRILIIDDDENVRLNFREILQPSVVANAFTDKLKEAGAELFGKTGRLPTESRKRSSATFDFELDEAANGKKGFQMVEKAVQEQRPYAAIFVDMRMPEWDGLETVRHIRQVDAKAEIIFVTAFSDHSIEEIVTTVGTNISYHCKPFFTVEIEQIATKSVYEWNKTRNLEELILKISQLRIQHWEMDSLLNNILIQVAYMLGTHSALIAIREKHRYETRLAIGNLCDEKASREYLQHLPIELGNEIYQDDNLAYFKIEKYGILAIFEKGGKPLNNERMYLVRLFLEQAAMAIRNVDLQDELVRQEKLSTIGQAISMLFHDLRNSVGNITSMAQAAQRHLDEIATVRRMLDGIEKCAGNGMKMAADLLDFVGNKPLEKIPVRVDNLIAYVRNNLMDMPIPAEAVVIRCDSPDAEFMGDFSKMSRTLLNLIRNAAEALSQAQTPNPIITLDIHRQAGEIIFAIRDNGPGIPEEIKDKIFIPFATFGKKGGTGLGLAIAKRFVEDHGGKITLNSTSEQGTEIMIALPMGALPE